MGSDGEWLEWEVRGRSVGRDIDCGLGVDTTNRVKIKTTKLLLGNNHNYSEIL